MFTSKVYFCQITKKIPDSDLFTLHKLFKFGGQGIY